MQQNRKKIVEQRDIRMKLLQADVVGVKTGQEQNMSPANQVDRSETSKLDIVSTIRKLPPA